ncbi:MAG: Rod binding domain-containing protein [Sulfitobacter sp.]|jgi:peptidoglycan hydrolase FlgJ
MTEISSLLMQGGLSPEVKARAEALKAEQTSKDFEAVFLTQFVDEMMKSAGPNAFGGEQQAEMWRSFMSEAVAKQLVEQGGLGLAATVNQAINAYSGATTQTEDESFKP